jgi:hypothetical protein
VYAGRESPDRTNVSDEVEGQGKWVQLKPGERGVVDAEEAQSEWQRVFGELANSEQLAIEVTESMHPENRDLRQPDYKGGNKGVMTNLDAIPDRMVAARTRGDGACCANAKIHSASGGNGRALLDEIGYGGNLTEHRDEGLLIATCALEGKPVVIFRENADGMEVLVNGNEGISREEFLDKAEYYSLNTGHWSRVYPEAEIVGTKHRDIQTGGNIMRVTRVSINDCRLPGKLASMVIAAMRARGVKDAEKVGIARETKAINDDEVVFTVERS